MFLAVYKQEWVSHSDLNLRTCCWCFLCIFCEVLCFKADVMLCCLEVIQSSCQMSTLLLFCSLYNHIQQPSKLGFGCDYCLFKVRSLQSYFFYHKSAALDIFRYKHKGGFTLGAWNRFQSPPPKVSACLWSLNHSLCVLKLDVRRRHTLMQSELNGTRDSQATRQGSRGPHLYRQTMLLTRRTNGRGVAPVPDQYETVGPDVDPPLNICFQLSANIFTFL